MSQMTMRERMLAVIRMEEADRVPFVQYSGLAAPDAEVWDLLGRDQMGILQWCSPYVQVQPNCKSESEKLEINGTPAVRNTLHTPAGSLTEERLIEPAYNTSAAHTHYVKEPEDYEILLAYLRDTSVHEAFDNVAQVTARLGEDGLPHCAVARSPYQQLWIQWVGPEDLSWHLIEHLELVDACADEMGRILREMFALVRQVDVPYVVFPDNITAPMIGPVYFRKYCQTYYRELAAMLADRDIPVFVHTDGDLRALWDELGSSGIRGLDSLSPPPDNDTSVADALRLWPEMSLLINYPSSLHLASPETIYQKTRQFLEEGGHSHRLQIQISENVPKDRWRISFPEITRAIADFTGEYKP